MAHQKNISEQERKLPALSGDDILVWINYVLYINQTGLIRPLSIICYYFNVAVFIKKYL